MQLQTKFAVAIFFAMACASASYAQQTYHNSAWNFCMPVPPGWQQQPQADGKGVTFTKGDFSIGARVSTYTVPAESKDPRQAMYVLAQTEAGNDGTVLSSSSIAFAQRAGIDALLQKADGKYERIVAVQASPNDASTYYVFSLNAPEQAGIDANQQLFDDEVGKTKLHCMPH